MTRETKIGLLVGLAFIIVIGILLSDHINSSTDPVRAEMTSAYSTVRQSVNAPDQRSQGSTAVIAPPSPVIPSNPVMTQPDSPAVNNGTAIINIGPGADPSQVQLPPRNSGHDQAAVAQTPDTAQPLAGPPDNQTQIASNNPPDSESQTPSNLDQLQNLARKNGIELVPVGARPAGANPVPPTAANPTPANVRPVKAEEGDNVSKLAAKYMGANTKANREAIIRSNPSMTPDGHLVFAGRTYQIPVAQPSVATTPDRQTQTLKAAPQPIQPAVQNNPAVARPPSGDTWYTVKENDNLWKIASEQLGSGTRWSEIKDLNADVLKGSEQVQVSMRLKMPAK